MKFYLETERLILRDLLPEDDPVVHKFLGNKPISTMQQAEIIISIVQKQYQKNGIGRWAVIEKSSGDFIGWSGLKLEQEVRNEHQYYFDVGYRLIPSYWGKGYATETCLAALQYGFEAMNLEEIIGTCHEKNLASRRVLEKCGLRFVEKFVYHDEIACDWLSIKQSDWAK
jgi:[ribosomal protein S5]-alanine N-acetyltransferase